MIRRRYVFKSPKLDEAFEKHLADPDAYELDTELALVRTCLAAVVRRIGDKEELDTLSPESVVALTEMSKNVSGIVENIAKIKHYFSNVITIEQFAVLIEVFAQVAIKFTPPERHAELLAELAKVPWPAAKTKGEGRRWAFNAGSPEHDPAFMASLRKEDAELAQAAAIGAAQAPALAAPVEAAAEAVQ